MHFQKCAAKLEYSCTDELKFAGAESAGLFMYEVLRSFADWNLNFSKRVRLFGEILLIKPRIKPTIISRLAR